MKMTEELAATLRAALADWSTTLRLTCLLLTVTGPPALIMLLGAVLPQ